MNELVHELLYVVITAAVPVITVYISTYLRKKFDQVESDMDNLIINNTISDVMDLIIQVVSSTSQTYVDSLKESGTFTEESQKIAFNRTKETILSLLSTESKEIIKSLYTDIDKWLDIQIEAAVRDQKLNYIKEGE